MPTESINATLQEMTVEIKFITRCERYGTTLVKFKDEQTTKKYARTVVKTTCG